jgi:spermidine/putrescine transport system substrate-binding protein
MMFSRIALLLVWALPFPVTADSLTLFTWEEYLSDAVVAGWEQDTGIAIKQVYYDSDEKRESVLAATGGRGFDLVVIDALAGRVLGRNGLLAPIPDSAVTNRSHIESRWRDSCGPAAVPYFWGTVGIVYRADRLAQAPGSWRQLLQPAPQQRQRIVMHQDGVDLLLPALLSLGYDFDTEDRGELRQAFALLRRQESAVLSYDYILTLAKREAQREQVDMALAYSGDQFVLNELAGAEQWAYAVPREGTAIWMDCLAVLGQSQRRDAALRFIDYLNDPVNAAANARDVRVATPNGAALAMLDEDLLADEDIYPPATILERSHVYGELAEDNVKLRDRIVSAVVERHEAR